MKSPCLAWILRPLISTLLPAGLLLVLAAALGSGCGKKESDEAAATPPAPATQASAEGEGAGEPDASAENESTTEAFVIDLSQPATPAEYDSAFKKHDYEKATAVALRMSAQNVPGADTLNRMRELQDQIARAAAEGDPKAKRAAEMLRRIGRLPTGPAP